METETSQAEPSASITEPNASSANPEDFAELFAEQPDLSRLVWALRRARGFALYFARCNVPAYRQKLLDALVVLVPRPIVYVTIQPLGETDNPFDRATVDAMIEAKLVHAPTNAVVFMTGLENLLPSRQPDVMMATLQEINWRRSAFQRTECPVVIWLPEYALTAMAQYAPDLYDWYSGVHELDVPNRMRSEVTRSTLDQIYEKQGARWLAHDERHRWAEVLHELLAQSETNESGTADAVSQSDLLSQLGRFYREQAQYTVARNYLEKAFKIAEVALGPNHPKVATRLNNLASVLQDQGELAQARSLLEQALKINQATLGPDHSKVAVSLNNLAEVLQDQGELAQARSLLEQALKINEAAFSPDHPNISANLNNLASVFGDLSELAQARDLLKRALKIAEATLGPDHPAVATSFNNLASVLRDLGELAQARSLLEQSLKINEAVFGPGHPNVAVSLNNLANVLRDLGELAQAHSLLERFLKICQKVFGDQHPKTKITANNLTILNKSKPKGKKRTPPKQKKRKRSK